MCINSFPRVLFSKLFRTLSVATNAIYWGVVNGTMVDNAKAATGNSPDNVSFNTPVELLTIGHMGG